MPAGPAMSLRARLLRARLLRARLLRARLLRARRPRYRHPGSNTPAGCCGRASTPPVSGWRPRPRRPRSVFELATIWSPTALSRRQRKCSAATTSSNATTSTRLSRQRRAARWRSRDRSRSGRSSGCLCPRRFGPRTRWWRSLAARVTETDAAVELAYREAYGSVLATLIRFLGGDFDAAEEALADAFTTALETWPRDGIPNTPAAWLTTAARNRALARIRRDKRQAERLVLLERELADMEVAPMQLGTDGGLADDRLRLIFTCCHPALPLDSRVALTLRTLGGLTTPEIARAFLVPEATLAQRLVRAKRKIRQAGIPYRVPPGEDLPERLDGVLATLYLVFNEGYLASAGDTAVRHELCADAIRLAVLVADLMPDRPETHGLLALLLLQDSRREARVGPDGSIALLEEKDRTRWDSAEIERGGAGFDRCCPTAGSTTYGALPRTIRARRPEPCC